MKQILKITISIMSAALLSQSAMAAFPQDFSDVVFVENNAAVANWPVTSQLEASVSGGTINVPHSKRSTWSITNCRFSSNQRVNANVWGFVKVNGVWHAGTWEYLRAGVTVRTTSAFGGAGHFRGAIGTFRPQVGEIYGFMVSGIARDSLNCVNNAERSNVVLWRWGVGPVAIEEPGSDVNASGPAVNLLLGD